MKQQQKHVLSRYRLANTRQTGVKHCPITLLRETLLPLLLKTKRLWQVTLKN